MKPSAAQYLQAIDPTLYSVSQFPGPYFASTSNIVESANATHLKERELPVLDMACGSCHKEMHRRFLHCQTAMAMQDSQLVTPWGTTLLLQSGRWAQVSNAQMSDTTYGTAVRGNHRFDVSLEQKTCSCRRYQDPGVPCGHSCAVIGAIGKAPRDFMPDYLTRQHWVNAYSKNIRPLSQASIIKLKNDHEEIMKSITEASSSAIQRVKTRMTPSLTLAWARKLQSASHR